jgi:hypothetical protein
MKIEPKITARETPLPLEIAAALQEMLDELESFRLWVVLVPCRFRTNSGGCIRVAAEKNAPWYREFCRWHASSRKRKNLAFDTKIKRRNTHRVLAALVEGKKTASQYAPEFISIAKRKVRANPAAYFSQPPANEDAEFCYQDDPFDQTCPF